MNLGFCTNLIDAKEHLLLAPGSLMIDVFIRANYTSDSNAMMVGFLRSVQRSCMLLMTTTENLQKLKRQ